MTACSHRAASILSSAPVSAGVSDSQSSVCVCACVRACVRVTACVHSPPPVPDGSRCEATGTFQSSPSSRTACSHRAASLLRVPSRSPVPRDGRLGCRPPTEARKTSPVCRPVAAAYVGMAVHLWRPLTSVRKFVTIKWTRKPVNLPRPRWRLSTSPSSGPRVPRFRASASLAGAPESWHRHASEGNGPSDDPRRSLMCCRLASQVSLRASPSLVR
jgi:hypothetical protein